MNNPQTKRKLLLFRSWHRGTREMDLLLGRFADAHVPSFSEQQLDDYLDLLENSDPDIYNWVSGVEKPPAEKNSAILQMITSFYK